MQAYERKRLWKIILLMAAMAIGGFSLWYTRSMVKELAAQEDKKIKLWANATRQLGLIENNMDINFLLDIIKDNETIPTILVDDNGKIVATRNLDSLQLADSAYLYQTLQEMKEEYGEASIIQWALENNPDKLRDWCYLDSDTQELKGPLAKRFEQAIRLEGTKSNQSKHAAGVVIAEQPLAETCPMVYDAKNEQLIAGMEMQDLESIGVIKFDILGIAMLDKIMTIRDLLKNGEYNVKTCTVS